MNQKTKQIIIALIVIVVAFIGFKMFFVDEESSAPALVSDNPDQVNFVDGQIILALLNRLEKVTLDDSIFTNKVFISLESFERVLEGQVAGRKNPFLPIGMDSATVLPKPSATSSKTR